MLGHVPEFCRLITSCRDFFIRANEIDNSSELVYGKNYRQVRRMGKDAPKWLVTLCQKHMQSWFQVQEKAGKYEYHFRTVGESLVLPYEQSLCWEILLTSEMDVVEKGRASMIADFLHSECSLWYKKTQDQNRTVKNKKLWTLAPIVLTKLISWSDDAFRYVDGCGDEFDPTDEYDETIRKGITCTNNHICLALAKFFQLLGECISSGMERSAVNAATKQDSVLSSYLTVYPKYSMIPKACPLFVVLEKSATNSQEESRFQKACKDAKWLSTLVSSMQTAGDLTAILNNFAPMGKDADMDDKCKSTICQSVKTAFDRFDWNKFKESDGTHFLKHINYIVRVRGVYPPSKKVLGLTKSSIYKFRRIRLLDIPSVFAFWLRALPKIQSVDKPTV